LQILQLDQEFRNDVLKELREIEGKVAELRERFTGAEDQLKRVDIRAPVSGVVHQLTVHTVGGVIANGETVMMIVPQSDKLVVEAKEMPQEIDQIALGAHVMVRIKAGKQRTNPDVAGVVANISADLTRDPQSGPTPGPPYYLVRIELNEDSVHLLRNLNLVPGMPAEAFIQTTFRTPLEYFLKPLSEQIARAFRER
jgi:HlyD family secretion protein